MPAPLVLPAPSPPAPTTTQGSTFIIVPKKEKGEWRLVVDYRGLNEQTEHDSYSLPLIDSILQKQQKKRIFTVLDLKHGYHQMPLHPDSRPCTAMSTPLGPMQWKVVPMGAKNGNAAFQRMMEDLLGPVRDCADPFVDDIIIGSGTENMTEDELMDAHEKDLRRVLSELDKHNMVCKPTKASLFVKEVEFAGHVVGHGQRRPMPGKLASLHHWEKPQTISELRSFMGFCNYYSGYVRMYAELSGPLHKMLQVGKFDGRKGSKKKLAWTPEAEDAFNSLKERLLGQLGLFLVDPDKGFVLRTDASDYAVGAVLEQVRDDGTHVPVAFWSRILAEGQRRTWTAREKKTYAIVCALRKWSGHIGLQPVVVCTDHQSLQSWHKEHVDTPSGPAARRARWHETFAKFDLSVVYVPGKDNTVADCLSRWAYPAGKAWMDISSHGDAEETEEAKRIIDMEKVMEQEGVKCFVVMANRTDLAKFRGARVQAIREETLEQWMVAPVELVRSVVTEDWSDDYAASEHWSRYWNAVSAPSDDEWPEGLTEDGNKLFLKDKLLVPENRAEELIDHWHNAQLMHPGRDKMQQDLEWRFKFPPGYYAILDRYCSDCAVCRATKSPNHSTAGNPVYTAIPEAPMRSVAMDVFAMPEVTVEGETYDCVILAVDRHSGYIVAVPGKKSKKKDKHNELDKHNMVCKPTKASLFVKEVEFAGHVVGHGQRRPMPGKLASLHHWEKPQTISELRSFMGFCNYYSGYVRMYAELSGPLHKMLQVGKFDGRKGSKKKLAWTPEAEDAFNSLKERLLGQLGLFLVDPDKGFVLRTDASDYAVGAVLEQVRDDGTHVPVAFWSRILAEGQRRTWTAREKKTYAIVCALRKWSGHIGLQPVVVCTDHQSLQSWHKEHVDTPSGPAARRARWHETFAKFDLSVVYVPGKDNTVADCLSRWAYPAGKAWMDISSHGDAEETEEAKRIIDMEKVMEQEGVKCFVVMANRTDLAKFRGARVQAIREETLEQWMVAPVELVRSVVTEDWSDDYAASEHWSRYWNAVSAPSDDEWPEGLTEDGNKLFLKDKLLVPENRVEELIDHWHNAQLMHPGRDKMQQDLEWRFKFPPGYYAILDRYCSDCAVCRATKSPNHSTAGNPVYTAIPEAPMRSVAMDVFAMPEVTVEGETYDCVILAVDRHSGYIVAVPGKKSKKKDKKDKHGLGLQAKTVANAMIRHWLTIFDVPAVICSDQGSQFVGTWFKTMCKHMGIRHAKTVAYHSRWNGRAEVAGREMFEKFRQLHIDEPGWNWYNSLWRVLQAYHDLPGPTGLSPHRILFLRDRVSRTLLWMNHGKVARDANAMMAEADNTAAKVCKALQDEHDKRAKYFKQGKVQKYALQDTVWVERHHKDVLSRHRQASWYVPGVIVRKVGQDVYAVRVGDNKILDRTTPSFVPEHQTPADVPSPSSSRPAMWTRTTRVRTTISPPKRSWRTSRTRGRLGVGFIKSVGRVSPHPGIRGNLRAVLCRGTPRSGWTT